MLWALVFSAPPALATTSSSRSRAPSMSPIWRNSSASSSLRASGSFSSSGAWPEGCAGSVKSPKSSVGLPAAPPELSGAGALGALRSSEIDSRSTLGFGSALRCARRAGLRHRAEVEIEVEVGRDRAAAVGRHRIDRRRREARGRRHDRLRHRAGAQRLDDAATVARHVGNRCTARLVHRVLGVDLAAEFLGSWPNRRPRPWSASTAAWPATRSPWCRAAWRTPRAAWCGWPGDRDCRASPP